jgi:transcriptional regulator with XRE-family HTH domain
MSAVNAQRPDDETIGERIRRLRRARGLRQRDLAAAGISPAYASRIESGERTPSPQVVQQLAHLLGVRSEDILDGDANDPRDEREVRLADTELALRLDVDTEVAEAALRDVLAEAEAAGDDLHAARARAALGLAAFHRGAYGEAVERLEAAIAGGLLSPLAHPDVHATLARSYVPLGRAGHGVDHLEACLRLIEAEAPDDAAAYVRFASYLSYALSDIGDVAASRRILARALDRGRGLSDPYVQIRLRWSQARLAATDHDSGAALFNLRRAVALLEATEDTRHLARAHLLWAEILTFENDAAGAEPHLELAERMLGPAADAEDAYWLRSEQARAAAGAGRHGEAVALAREALALIGDADPAERGTALWALGEGLEGEGELAAAVDALAASRELLLGARLWREGLAVARSLARVLTELGRDAEAFQVLDEAAAAATGIRQPTPR